ncbi:MAG: hypothetical protein Q9M15_03700 [Mariprofundaceae bacterium]|nr:hypothetical protein [Mariprofundaceae bacterium]
MRMILKASLLCWMICTGFMPYQLANAATQTNDVMSNLNLRINDLTVSLLNKDKHKSLVLYDSIQLTVEKLRHQMKNQAFDEKKYRELMMAYAWIRVISINFKKHAWIGAAISSNQLHATFIRFTEYTSKLQSDGAWIRYLSWDLMLLNLEDPKSNAQLLKFRRDNLISTWEDMSEILIKNFRNKSLFMAGNQLILALKKAKTPQQVIALTKKILLLMDQIKRD